MDLNAKRFQFDRDGETIQRQIEARMVLNRTYDRNDLVETAATRWARKLAGENLSGFTIAWNFLQVLDGMKEFFEIDTLAGCLEYTRFGMHMITTHAPSMLEATVADLEVYAEAKEAIDAFKTSAQIKLINITPGR